MWPKQAKAPRLDLIWAWSSLYCYLVTRPRKSIMGMTSLLTYFLTKASEGSSRLDDKTMWKLAELFQCAFIEPISVKVQKMQVHCLHFKARPKWQLQCDERKKAKRKTKNNMVTIKKEQETIGWGEVWTADTDRRVETFCIYLYIWKLVAQIHPIDIYVCVCFALITI